MQRLGIQTLDISHLFTLRDEFSVTKVLGKKQEIIYFFVSETRDNFYPNII